MFALFQKDKTSKYKYVPCKLRSAVSSLRDLFEPTKIIYSIGFGFEHMNEIDSQRARTVVKM